jgi:hypothetical protein
MRRRHRRNIAVRSWYRTTRCRRKESLFESGQAINIAGTVRVEPTAEEV